MSTTSSLQPSISAPPSTSLSLSSSQAPSTQTPQSPESQRQIREARVALEASLTNIGSSLDSTLRSRAQNLHANSTALSKQEDTLRKETLKLGKEGEKLRKLADEGQKRVKETGNVQNWAEMLERDFLVLQETLRLVEEGSSGTGSEWETDSEGDERPGERKRVDGDGDTVMRDEGAGDVGRVEEAKDKGKGVETAAEAELEEHMDAAGGSSTAGTADGFGSDPSSSSIHTSASVAS